MNLPDPEDYIDIHTHYEASLVPGTFSVISLMAHEAARPGNIACAAWTFGIHPWFLKELTHEQQIKAVDEAAGNPSVIAVGEAGFDKLRGPSTELQRRAFEEQVTIASGHSKPVIIHCVRSWEELFRAYKRLKPSFPWLVHGFRGNKDLAAQLISKNMFLSFWFDFIIRPEASELIRTLPRNRIFLETDGSGMDIREIYKKVSSDMELTVDQLKDIICRNFLDFFFK